MKIPLNMEICVLVRIGNDGIVLVVCEPSSCCCVSSLLRHELFKQIYMKDQIRAWSKKMETFCFSLKDIQIYISIWFRFLMRWIRAPCKAAILQILLLYWPLYAQIRTCSVVLAAILTNEGVHIPNVACMTYLVVSLSTCPSYMSWP